jgi:integrase
VSPAGFQYFQGQKNFGLGLTSQRRTKQTDINTPGIGNYTFRGTGITTYLLNADAKLEHVQCMAAHADPKTTRLYDRRSDQVSLDEVERILIYLGVLAR